MMEISKNTLKRGIESDIVFKNIYLLFNNFKNHLSFSDYSIIRLYLYTNEYCWKNRLKNVNFNIG